MQKIFLPRFQQFRFVRNSSFKFTNFHRGPLEIHNKFLQFIEYAADLKSLVKLDYESINQSEKLLDFWVPLSEQFVSLNYDPILLDKIQGEKEAFQNFLSFRLTEQEILEAQIYFSQNAGKNKELCAEIIRSVIDISIFKRMISYSLLTIIDNWIITTEYNRNLYSSTLEYCGVYLEKIPLNFENYLFRHRDRFWKDSDTNQKLEMLFYIFSIENLTNKPTQFSLQNNKIIDTSFLSQINNFLSKASLQCFQEQNKLVPLFFLGTFYANLFNQSTILKKIADSDFIRNFQNQKNQVITDFLKNIKKGIISENTWPSCNNICFLVTLELENSVLIDIRPFQKVVHIKSECMQFQETRLCKLRVQITFYKEIHDDVIKLPLMT